MKVAIDMQLALGTATGIGEYARGLADALRQADVGVFELCEPKLDPWRFDRRLIWDQVLLPRKARACAADLLHCASGTMPARPPLPTVVTVHDVAWFKTQAHTRPYARYYFGSFSLHQYRRAACIAVDSEFSRGQLLELGDFDRVRVVYPGVSADYCNLVRKAEASNVVLVAGTVEPRKNLEILVRALPELDTVRIISAGPFTPYREKCVRLAKDLGVSDRLEFRGYVDREELLQLFATCALVAVPSKYEGFGYAAAQALCAGAPLLVSDRASLPEICAGDAAIASAEDEMQWQRAIAQILADRGQSERDADSKRSGAIARFSWAASAAKTIAVSEKALETLVHG